MNRREFILLTSGILLTGCDDAGPFSSPPILRFAVASDGHYGEPNTPSGHNYATLVSAINDFHRKNHLDFCLINGDIVHDNQAFFIPARAYLERLQMRYLVSKGNHDKVTEDEWRSIWGLPANFAFTLDQHAFLILTTSNEQGAWLCPDLGWLQQTLYTHRNKKNIFIFMHINPAAQAKFAVDCQQIMAVLAEYPRIRAVFNGHDHDQDNVLVKNNIPFIFDGHFGGSWGTQYHGFRIVEIRADNTLLSYMMNPQMKINQFQL
ncbi:metallophosphoesterase family protein [Pantoea sp. B65]|uniref:metallophosphoesterase family protein n=1 Tax=Pantoea sp. B65 TaxID=2813359 RepID=UPI0039B46B39